MIYAVIYLPHSDEIAVRGPCRLTTHHVKWRRREDGVEERAPRDSLFGVFRTLPQAREAMRRGKIHLPKGVWEADKAVASAPGFIPRDRAQADRRTGKLLPPGPTP